MRVAAYHPWVYLKGGGERTLLELMRRSRHDWTLYTNHFEPESTFPGFRDLPVVELGRVSVRRTVAHVAGACLRVLAQPIPLDGAGALMISSEGLGNLVALRPRPLPVFCFCHTPLKVAYDPFTRHRYFTERPGAFTRWAIGLYTRVDRLGWRRYERVFCNSREVANRVLGARLVAPGRVEVNYPGVDLTQFDPDGPREPYFLLAGRIARTKTIELGIDAFLRLKRRHPSAAGYRLVIAGMVDQKSWSYYRDMIARAAADPAISFVVDPTDATLFDLYRRCHAALFTALNEDWGLVPLEAMAAARPVIAVKRGGPLESIVDGETGLLCPAEPAAFAEAMAQLVARPERAAVMGVAARRHVARFSWEAFVGRMDDYVEALVLKTRAIRGEYDAHWRRRRLPSV
jgi:glycosyltransferase involved in cell wall biosynthesis